MSDDIPLNTSHLCTTEDAFEQFQAVSMYQEDEFITLSDLMPSEPRAPDSDELLKIPYDNEVVLSTSDVCEDVYSTTTAVPPVPEVSNSDLDTGKKEEEVSFESDVKPEPKKRGRKKKNNSENSSFALPGANESSNEQKNNHGNDIEKTELLTNSITSHITRGKRGRPPKKRLSDDISTSFSESNSISEPSVTLTTDPDDSVPFVSNKKRGRPSQKNVDQTRRQRKKPGRPPKSKVHNNQILPVADSTTTDNLHLSEISSSENDNSFNKAEKTLQKRRRVQKKSTDLVADSNTAGTLNENDSEDIDLSNMSNEKSLNAKRFKKGRTDLNVLNEVDRNNDVNTSDDKKSNNANLSENDESDELSLSELKKMPDETKPHSTATNIATAEANLDSLKNSEDMLSESVIKTPKKGKKGKPKKVPLDNSLHDAEKTEPKVETISAEVKQDDDEKDDLSLSQLKQTLDIDIPTVDSSNMVNQETPSKRSTKMPIMSDFEYNIDSIVGNEVAIDNNPDQSLLVEDHSKRPIRRKTKTLHYDESSDEDPFANMESSDEEPIKHRKGNKYYSDDEYQPGFVKGKNVETSDTDISEKLDEPKKKKKGRRQTEVQSHRKRGMKSDTNVLDVANESQNVDGKHDDDIEEVLQSSVITAGDEQTKPSQAWGNSNAFENFLAKKIQRKDLKIKKVSAAESFENVTPIEIPVIVPEAKKTVEMCSQTNTVKTETASVQTSLQFDIPMKENVALTKDQSEKACQFLNSIVQTTAELGHLMTQKSEDFIKKKIHTEHVTDTFKMDYCVKKSFLLFKLAKHNLMQMEEDLANQYEDFLKSNNLLYCREQPKQLIAKPKVEGSDSDCEIVEEIKPPKETQDKPKFNPKTVFLNKELSIKIAKKPSETQRKINIKGRHSVWINDTVVVKKVKPMQSFLAQDSRNKKPPDNFVTTEMVSEFFKKYYRQQALTVCAPFISTEWRNRATECICNYFVVEPVKLDTGNSLTANNGLSVNNETRDISVTVVSLNDAKPTAKMITNPESLFKMSFRILQNELNVSHHKMNKLADGIEQPIELFHLCLGALNTSFIKGENSKSTPSKTMSDCSATFTALSLKTLCYRRIIELDFNSISRHKETQNEKIIMSPTKYNNSKKELCISLSQPIENNIKSLFSLCVELILNKMYCTKLLSTWVSTPNTLQHIAFENIKHLLYKSPKNSCSTGNNLLPSCHVNNVSDDVPTGILTINSVNTLSEEAFLNLEQPIDISGNSDDIDDTENDDSNIYEDSNFNPDVDSHDENASNETNWVSQLQMAELRSCSNPFNSIEEPEQNNELLTTRIKIEPLEDPFQNTDESSVVKTEPGVNPDEMTIIPDVETIKPEITGDTNSRTVQRQNSSSYDVDAFESFVRTSKLMNNEEEYSNEDIFSQSALRVRKQHEPDLDEDIDMNMSLLIPQTFEPLNIETAKGSLMETSSDEGSKNKKIAGKKKIEKRRGRPRKINSKNVPAAITKDKVTNNEVATITRRMRDKIRQEEQKELSSDSETENIPIGLRSKKDHSEKPATSKNVADEIQCNNVDSTKNVTDEITEEFPGFTAIDQNETTSYQKLMKYVYDKIVPNTEDDDKTKKKLHESKDKSKEKSKEKSTTPLFDSNEPVELLECEPTMPVFEDSPMLSSKKVEESTKTVEPAISFTEHNGWKCYPVNKEDEKLYQSAYVSLEKLPESFVETYFQYQDIAHKNKDDVEVERLTNLNTLNRASNLKEAKTRGKSKRESKDQPSEPPPEIGSRPCSPANSDRYELTPSEDEGGRAEEELPPAAPRQTENILAKDSLMNDNDSDSDRGTKVKKEPGGADQPKQTRLGRKKHILPSKVENVESDNLMLTADKVMNKELTLLHAPVVLNADDVDTSNKPGVHTRSKQKSATKNQTLKGQVKNEDDSSSEEEKQWVNTKEKLLKRLGKREDASVDDAKRAKLVSEFIERRGDVADSHKRPRGGRRRSRKKFFERQKQLRVLSMELFGEASIESGHNKRSGQAIFKGRRNIRKVIDKKSLARSTVIANMEEFERKRRLNSRQSQLRELLGCEEGVNVLVINDEVCLEYDFEENRPVVTIHPFFTRVMKAHQYEGVKFMWDACFESLDVLESGHAGGGCILAHCMGLGKTLQVLALLHTVLTHPRVGMRRVLVCCPLSTVLNWVDEIHKWLGPVTNQIKVFELSKLKKTYERAYQLEDWYNGGGIFIIGYELFRNLSTLNPLHDDVRPTIINKIRTALLDPGPDIIVCDEGHLLKNDCSVLALAMSRVVTRRRIVLTGTPMQNNLREYYCMVNFVKPNLLGTYAEYSNRFENPIMNGQHRDSQEEDIKLMKARTHILHKVLEGCLQRQEASVLYPYLPKKHEYTVFIPLTTYQWDMYKYYLSHYSRQGKHGILKDFHILHKIWSHPQVFHNFHTKAREEKTKIKEEKVEDDLATEDQEEIKPNMTEQWWLDYLEAGKMLDSLEASNKFVVVFRILDECIALGDKMLIFSTSLFCLDGLEYFLKKINKWSLGQEYFRLDGSVPAEVRQKWCREFNADSNVKTKLFLVSTRAGCLGLNMTAANRVVILDTSWNPAHDIQSIFRVYRFGQKKDCYIYRLVAMGTMEQKIYERSVTKQAVSCRVVDEQQIDRHYNSADLTELYRFDDSGSSVACGVAVGVQDVVLLRVARAAALHAVHEHDSLLRGSEPALPEHERAAAWHQFQQEQEDKQVQNKLIKPIPKIPLKRIHGHEYAMAPPPPTTSVTHIKEENNEAVSRPGPKSKKGRKPGVKCCIPVQDHDNQVENVDVKTRLDRTARALRRSKATEEPTEILGTNNHFEEARVSRPIPSVQIIGSKTTTAVEDPDEEVLVQKISDILVRHNFHTKKLQIASLIAQVKQIISGDKRCIGDALSRNIAEVLLNEGVAAPKVSNIVCESITTAVSAPEEITGDLEARVPDTHSESKSVEESYPHRRTRRKNIKYENTVTQNDIINLDDEDDDLPDRNFEKDVEYTPDPREARKINRKINPAPKQNKAAKKNNKFPAQDNQRVSKTPNKDTNFTCIENEETDSADSIWLSDDEAPPTTVNKADPPSVYPPKATRPPVKKPDANLPPIKQPTVSSPPVNQPTVNPPTKNQPIVNQPTVNPPIVNPPAVNPPKVNPPKKPPALEPPVVIEDDEIVPLPTSLLTNNNFIKIVAHTYSAGNPMLDEDAAMLAAQYSTFRALTESKQSGKEIVTGPLYDIAVKVLGIPTLKKLSTVNVKSSTLETNAERLQFKEKKEKRAASESSRKEPQIEPSASTSTADTANEPTFTDVVPVGLIKRGAPHPNEPYSQLPNPVRDECILPDDDVHIISSPPPAPPSPPQPVPRPPPLLPLPTLKPAPTCNRPQRPIPPTNTVKHKPTILNRMLDSPQSNLFYPSQSEQTGPTIEILNGKVLTNTPSEPTAVLSNDTICLDSDEEETVTSNDTPVGGTTMPTFKLQVSGAKCTVLPVAVGAHRPPPTLLNHTQLPPQQNPKKPAPNTQRKFVLVPASHVPQALLNPTPEKSTSAPQPGIGTPTVSSPAVVSESILPTTPNAPVATARIKPGDVFRLSDNGVIEILGKEDIEAVTKSTAAVKTSTANTTVHPNKSATPVSTSTTDKAVTAKKTVHTSKNATPNKSAVDAMKTTSANKPQKVVEAKPSRATVSSSSSNSSRSPSPDPLSILKDVVHIQAAEEPSQRKNIVTNKHKNSNISLEHIISVDLDADDASANTSLSNTAKVTKVTKSGTLFGVFSDTAPKQKTIITMDKNGKVRENSWRSSNKGTATINKAKPNSTKPSSKIAATPNSNTKQTVQAKPLPKPSDRAAPSTKVAGNLKNIVLEGSGKGVSMKRTATCTDATGTRTIQVTEVKKLPSGSQIKATPSFESKKRPLAVSDTSSDTKKRKIPMTLKDFDIDDIDDIIELE